MNKERRRKKLRNHLKSMGHDFNWQYSGGLSENFGVGEDEEGCRLNKIASVGSICQDPARMSLKARNNVTIQFNCSGPIHSQ